MRKEKKEKEEQKSQLLAARTKRAEQQKRLILEVSSGERSIGSESGGTEGSSERRA